MILFSCSDLKLGTEYELTVKGMNRLGDSLFQEKVLKARTAGDHWKYLYCLAALFVTSLVQIFQLLFSFHHHVSKYY